MVIVYTDGASRGNPGRAAFGVVIFDHVGTKLEELGRCIGPGTNNEAEYHGVIEGLKAAARFTAAAVEMRSDSEVVVRQLTGAYAVRERRLQDLAARARAAASPFARVDYRHVPREHPGSQRADRLANRALDLEERAGGAGARPSSRA